MTLYVAEKQEEGVWCPVSFWIGPFKFALISYPDCRIRRVMSRFEANELDVRMPPQNPLYQGFINFDWSIADEYTWTWPT